MSIKVEKTDKTNEDFEDAVRLYRRAIVECEGQIEILEAAFQHVHDLPRQLQTVSLQVDRGEMTFEFLPLLRFLIPVSPSLSNNNSSKINRSLAFEIFEFDFAVGDFGVVGRL